MSAAQVTPRKRKVGDGVVTPSSRGVRVRGPPTPNPPIAPFPTPRSRHRVKDEPLAMDEIVPLKSVPVPVISGRKALPPHLQLLLNLHHALNLALSLHIATHPPVLPPHTPSTTTIELPALTNFLAIRDAVERTSGRRFGLAELGRLAWVWTWDGQEVKEQGVTVQSAKEQMKEEADDNPFLVQSNAGPQASDAPSTIKQVAGLSYLITSTRTLDSAGRKVHTYGLGVELDLKPGETRQVLANGNEGGLGNRGQGGGTGAIGRWSAGGETRERVFRERLDKWVELHGGWEPPADVETVHGLPTPAASRDSGRSTIPPIPLLPLPHLPASSGLLPAATLFSSPGASVSTPRKANRPTTTTVQGLSDPFSIEEGPITDSPKKTKVSRPGSVEERRQAMMDRIKARGTTSVSQPLATLGSSVAPSARRVLMSASETQEELKRRSTLSRLEGVAEAVWMMFSGPSLGASSLPTPPRGRRKAIPMDEAADVVFKSSKTPISLAEAYGSLKMLCDLCPWFLSWKVVARKEWLEMPPQVVMSACPPSPGSDLGIRAHARASAADEEEDADGEEARGTMAPRPPVSPSAKGRPRLPDREREGSPSPSPRVSTPTRGQAGWQLVGAASPGRVRRTGGLREVRERIRRELEG